MDWFLLIEDVSLGAITNRWVQPIIVLLTENNTSSLHLLSCNFHLYGWLYFDWICTIWPISVTFFKIEIVFLLIIGCFSLIVLIIFIKNFFLGSHQLTGQFPINFFIAFALLSYFFMRLPIFKDNLFTWIISVIIIWRGLLCQYFPSLACLFDQNQSKYHCNAIDNNDVTGTQDEILISDNHHYSCSNCSNIGQYSYNVDIVYAF